jgi:tetratricopeptide (TPR) repeat protein
MLDPYPRTQLCLILKQYGESIINEPKRCKALLNDLAPQHHLEVVLLMAALEQQVAEELLKPNELLSIEMKLKRLAQVLHDTTGIEDEFAYWAVESWALALEVIQQPLPILSIQPKLDVLSSPFSVTNAKQSRKKAFILFFSVWAIASIVVVSAFSSRINHEANVTKPATANQQVMEGQKTEDGYTSPEQRDAWTQNNLGDLYYYGYGVVQDYQKAAEWYRKAAEQGSASGQCNLGFMYTNGYGVTKDYSKAVEWYRKAAEQGNADGENNLGIMYENGYGVAKDRQKAMEWYGKAVEQGHYGAQQTLKRLVDKS